MKPEEAIERLHQFLQQSIGIIEDADRGDDYAVKVKEDAEKDLSAIQLAIEALKEVQQYREIGTVEECRAAMEKQKPEKCVEDSCPDHTHYKCPSCGKIQKTKYGDSTFGCILNNCSNCGQALMDGNEDD